MRDTRVDWFRVMHDLNRAGYSTRAFADSLGIARTTILGWKQGAEPKHADGEKLLRWWGEVTGRPIECAPREPRLSGIRPAPTSNMPPVPTLEAYAMPRGIPKAREVQTPGEVAADPVADEVEITEAEGPQEDPQEIADRTGRPYLCQRQGWVLPSAPNPNVAKIGGR